ncbi:hypothetical protein L1887_36011 [Cichorium endivia]|nr:hypothetical protein L1887_36011 [Cichorium endivia]
MGGGGVRISHLFLKDWVGKKYEDLGFALNLFLNMFRTGNGGEVSRRLVLVGDGYLKMTMVMVVIVEGIGDDRWWSCRLVK